MIVVMENIVKKTLVSVFVLVCSIMGYAQGGIMTFDGKETSYEIRDQRRIGPGTTYTEYYFNDIGSLHYTMRALVVEIDNTNEYTYQTPFMARYSENQVYHQSCSKLNEFKYQRDIEGYNKPLASVMGGGFTQDALNEKSVMMEVGGGLVSRGVMHYMPQSGAVHYYVDGEGNVRIGVLTCKPKIVAETAGEYYISGYNRLRSNYMDGITVFANGYGKQTKFETADIEKNKGIGTEVIVALDNPASKIASGKYTGRVVETKTGSFNKFKEGQFVLAAVQGKSEEWLKSLAKGEKITIDFQYYDAQSSPVQLESCVKAFSGYAVKNGVAQGSGTHGYPQDALGLSVDGKKSYYIHLDNSTSSGDKNSTAPIALFNQFIQQIDGLYEAILMDGGPSAEMVVDGEWVSQSVGRYIPAAIMVYSKAKKSTIVAEVDFVDYSKLLYIGEGYTPNFYYYNKYGDRIDKDMAPDGIVLTCDEGLGKISADGKTFIPTAGGKGFLYCDFKGRKDNMYIEVSDALGVRVEPKTIEGSLGDEFIATLWKICSDGKEVKIDNSLVKWSTNNSMVVPTCKNGRIALYMPGLAEVYADYEGMRDVINITVATGIEQIEKTAPVSISVLGDNICIKANDETVKSMSCMVYAVDGKLIGSASVQGSVLDVSRKGGSSPVLIQITIDGKKYIYKLM